MLNLQDSPEPLPPGRQRGNSGPWNGSAAAMELAFGRVPVDGLPSKTPLAS